MSHMGPLSQYGFRENKRYLALGVLIIKILLPGVPYKGPLFSEKTPSGCRKFGVDGALALRFHCR